MVTPYQGSRRSPAERAHWEPCMAANRAASSKRAASSAAGGASPIFPILFFLAKRERAVHGGREKRFVSKLDLFRPSLDETWGPRKRPWAVTVRSCVGRGPRNLHIPRFWFAPKAHSFRCSASPHENRSAGFSRGPRSFRLSAPRIGVAGTGKDRKDQRSFPLPLAGQLRQCVLDTCPSIKNQCPLFIAVIWERQGSGSGACC